MLGYVMSISFYDMGRLLTDRCYFCTEKQEGRPYNMITQAVVEGIYGGTDENRGNFMYSGAGGFRKGSMQL